MSGARLACLLVQHFGGSNPGFNRGIQQEAVETFFVSMTQPCFLNARSDESGARFLRRRLRELDAVHARGHLHLVLAGGAELSGDDGHLRRRRLGVRHRLCRQGLHKGRVFFLEVD